jgi:hypothetical protein
LCRLLPCCPLPSSRRPPPSSCAIAMPPLAVVMPLVALLPLTILVPPVSVLPLAIVVPPIADRRAAPCQCNPPQWLNFPPAAVADLCQPLL